MAEAVRIPKLGLSDYGDLVSWEAAVGEHVEAGSVIAILESDKASAEIEAPVSGYLLEQYVAEGEEIPIEVGKPLGAIGEEGESAPPVSDFEDGATPSSPDTDGTSSSEPKSAVTPVDGDEDESRETDEEVKVTPRAKRRADEEDIDLAPVEGTGPEGSITESDIEAYLERGDAVEPADASEESASDSSTATDITATPRARRRANEEDIDLTPIDGTGPQGAVTENDVETFLQSVDEEGADGSATKHTSAQAGGLTVTESRTLSGTRKTIAERLTESAREKPHVMGTRDIGIERLEEVKDRLVNERGVEVSLNDLILHFVARTLEDLPEFNAHFEDGDHRFIDEVNVGYAVDSEKGLVVPVLKSVPELSLEELATERRRLVEAVLENDHDASDLQDGTFTVTNVGVFDMDVSYSIINPPEVAILALGRRKPVPVERNGEVKFERAITFSLTIDHRVLDGADSGAFLDRLAEYIEFPGRAFDAI